MRLTFFVLGLALALAACGKKSNEQPRRRATTAEERRAEIKRLKKKIDKGGKLLARKYILQGELAVIEKRVRVLKAQRQSATGRQAKAKLRSSLIDLYMRQNQIRGELKHIAKKQRAL